jgi:hypothetical protein
MPQFTGRAEIRVAGVLYQTLDGAKLSNPGGVSRPAVTGRRVYGFTEKTEVPTIDFKFPMSSGLSVATLMAVTDATTTFECDDGTIFTLAGSWVASCTDLTVGSDAALSGQIMAVSCTQS